MTFEGGGDKIVYAFRRTSQLPLDSKKNVTFALKNFNKIVGVTPDERFYAIDRILSAAKRFDIKEEKNKFSKKFKDVRMDERIR